MKGHFIIIGIISVIICSLVVLNSTFQRTLKLETAEQFSKQQQLLANAEASNIQAYFGGMRDETIHIARMASNFRLRGKEDFNVLAGTVLQDSDKVRKRINFLDRACKVIFSGGNLAAGSPPGRDLIRTSKSFCPDDVLIRHDTTKVRIVAPVCGNDSFVSAIDVSIDIQDLAKMFLGPIKSGTRGYAWMMDEKGDLLYHPTQRGMVGRNLYRTDSSCFRCHRSFDTEKKIIEGRSENYGRHVAPTGEDKILAFSTASVGYSRWIVAVSAPYSEVTMAIQSSMKFYSSIIVLIFVAAAIASAMLIFLYRKREKAEESLEHQKELERYAAELEQKVGMRTSELSAEKEKLNTIVNAIGSGIVLLDPQGRIQWINPAMQQIAGKDITGLFCEEICSDCAVVGSYQENELQTELMSNLFGKKDRLFQVTSAPVKGEDGGIHGYIRLVQDVTEMKKMEEQMMHSQKLASLERLTSGIASEIGNPLTSVFSFIEILEGMEQDEFKRETLETIYFHMNRIGDILRQLSGFSRTPTLEFKPCKVNAILENSLSLIQYDKRAQYITIVKELATGVPEITTDPNQLSQVFVNMILNAADAMPDGGTLTIRSRVKNSSVVVDFEDTGPGIEKEDLGTIFDPFHTAKARGAGLGLAVSYKIIKNLSGDLTAQSEPDNGSKFVITLPMGIT